MLSSQRDSLTDSFLLQQKLIIRLYCCYLVTTTYLLTISNDIKTPAGHDHTFFISEFPLHSKTRVKNPYLLHLLYQSFSISWCNYQQQIPDSDPECSCCSFFYIICFFFLYFSHIPSYFSRIKPNLNYTSRYLDKSLD